MTGWECLSVITHDMGAVSRLCHSVKVMYLGQVVEDVRTEELFRNPLHPYTQGLLSAIPRITKERKPLSTIEGMVPNPVERIKGCRFCQDVQKPATAAVRKNPPVFSVGEDLRYAAGSTHRQIMEVRRQ